MKKIRLDRRIVVNDLVYYAGERILPDTEADALLKQGATLIESDIPEPAGTVKAEAAPPDPEWRAGVWSKGDILPDFLNPKSEAPVAPRPTPPVNVPAPTPINQEPKE